MKVYLHRYELKVANEVDIDDDLINDIVAEYPANDDLIKTQKPIFRSAGQDWNNLIDYFNGIYTDDSYEKFFKFHGKFYKSFVKYLDKYIEMTEGNQFLLCTILWIVVFNRDVDNTKHILVHIDPEYLETFNPIDNVKNIVERICMMHGCGKTNIKIHVDISIKKSGFWGLADDDIVAIIDMLIKKTAKLITDYCYRTAKQMFSQNIIDCLNCYDTFSDDKVCYICLSSRMVDDMLTDNCKCKSFIHYQCLQKQIMHNGSMCKVCKTNIKHGNFSYRGETIIFFPHAKLYPTPLRSKTYTLCKTEHDIAEYSMYYYAFEEFEKCLSTISDAEKGFFLKSNRFIINNKSGKWKIQCVFPSNMHDVLGNIMIEKILNKYL